VESHLSKRAKGGAPGGIRPTPPNLSRFPNFQQRYDRGIPTFQNAEGDTPTMGRYSAFMKTFA
jgi:hypothetical protein